MVLNKLLIGNISFESTDEELQTLVEPHGKIVSCRIFKNPFSKVSRGTGYVEFENEENAEAFLKSSLKLGGRRINAREVIEEIDESAPSKRVHVRNIQKDATKDEILAVFKQFGEVEEFVRINDGTGKPRRFGFVLFKEVEDAKKAVEAEVSLNGEVLYPNFALSESISKPIPKSKFRRRDSQERKGRKRTRHRNYKRDSEDFSDEDLQIRSRALHARERELCRKIHIKNLPKETGNEELRNQFIKFGEVVKANVIEGGKDNDTFPCYGFVTFADKESATNAVAEKTHLINGLELSVEMAEQSRKDRSLMSELRRTKDRRRQNRNYGRRVYYDPQYSNPNASRWRGHYEEPMSRVRMENEILRREIAGLRRNAPLTRRAEPLGRPVYPSERGIAYSPMESGSYSRNVISPAINGISPLTNGIPRVSRGIAPIANENYYSNQAALGNSASSGYETTSFGPSRFSQYPTHGF